MSAESVAVHVLVSAGVLVIVASALLALAVPHVFDRLHLVTPATSLGAPLVGLGIAVSDGWGLATGQVLLVVLLVAATGPVLTAATGRVAGQREGIVAEDQPE